MTTPTKFRPARLAAVLAGTFLAMVAATGSTQAHAASSGALGDNLNRWADSVRPPVVWTHDRPCEDMYRSTTPLKS